MTGVADNAHPNCLRDKTSVSAKVLGQLINIPDWEYGADVLFLCPKFSQPGSEVKTVRMDGVGGGWDLELPADMDHC